ncbi:MAG: hypothetical protein U0821_04205 [Chloroflexota bacterium]
MKRIGVRKFRRSHPPHRHARRFSRSPRLQRQPHAVQRLMYGRNRDDVSVEGDVVEVHPEAAPPYAVIGNRDGLVTVVLRCGSQCPTIRVGDYLEADGEKIHEQRFEATEISITRR